MCICESIPIHGRYRLEELFPRWVQLRMVAQVGDCYLQRCMECGTLWEIVPAVACWASCPAADGRDPRSGQGYTRQKWHHSIQAWCERAVERYHERKLRLQEEIERYSRLGFDLVTLNEHRTGAILRRRILRRGPFGKEHIEQISLSVDQAGRVFSDPSANSGSEAEWGARAV